MSGKIWSCIWGKIRRDEKTTKIAFPKRVEIMQGLASKTGQPTHQDPVWKDRVFSCVKTRQKSRSQSLYLSMLREMFFMIVAKKIGGAHVFSGGSPVFFAHRPPYEPAFSPLFAGSLSVFCPGKSWPCIFPAARTPVFFAGNTLQNLPAA